MLVFAYHVNAGDPMTNQAIDEFLHEKEYDSEATQSWRSKKELKTSLNALKC